MRIKLSIGLCALALAGLTVGCSGSDTTNANANANTADPNAATANANASPANPTMGQAPTGTDPTQGITPGPNPPTPGKDNSEIQIAMDTKTGDVTETRTFKNNKNVTKVVRTTSGTKRTVTVYNSKGQSKTLPESKIDSAMDETGDALAAAAGWTVEKSKDAASATKEGAETVIDKTVQGSKTVGEKTVDGAKKVGEKTVEGAKKGANKVKDVVTP